MSDISVLPVYYHFCCHICVDTSFLIQAYIYSKVYYRNLGGYLASVVFISEDRP